MMKLLAQATGLVLLIACLPIMLILAVIVLALQGRPILFRQMRSGKNGVPFKLVKFRSMKDLRDSDGVLLRVRARITGDRMTGTLANDAGTVGSFVDERVDAPPIEGVESTQAEREAAARVLD